MEDDGLVLNFAVSDEPWRAKTAFKGGSWKDRLGAKKAAQYRQNKLSGFKQATHDPFSGSVDSTGPDAVARPPKRARLDIDRPAFTPSLTASASTPNPSTSRSEGRTGPPKEIISSLFTYNPTSVSQPATAQTAEDDQTLEPSNAPLTAELDPFTSLGLSKTLANHLLTRLNVKAPTAIQKTAITQLLKENSDAFLQSETGSGKTLAYLLPIVHRLIELFEKLRAHETGVASKSVLGRHTGLFAIILAPTRELSKQISTVLESLLGCAHYLVAGIVTGGEKKKSEKARLRKGVNILVATPGRLADHLNNTEVLDVSRVRWLVLDEGDRLMELGFDQDIQRIVSVLNLRARKEVKGPEERALMDFLPSRRTTVLCSATLKTNVLRLGEISLRDAAHIAVDGQRKDGNSPDGDATRDQDGFSAPAQLKQSYAVVPAKMRLVALVAMLRKAFDRRGSVMKAIVFISCADSVDFHFELLTRGGSTVLAPVKVHNSTTDDDKDEQDECRDEATHPVTTQRKATLKKPGRIVQGTTISEQRTWGMGTCISTSANPVTVYRLHGSLIQATRTSTLKAFSEDANPAVLVCTDVASRGLDLPNIDVVIEYDPPFSKDDHLHRIGRTARAGRDGRAVIFLQPGCEEGYVEILQQGRRDLNGRGLIRREASEIVQKGFAPTSGVVNKSASCEAQATQFQLEIERWVLESPRHMEQARRAFQSHVRAYATHVAAERGFFDIKALHLGHLAKAFALRDRPGAIKVPGARPSGKKEAGTRGKSAAISALGSSRTENRTEDAGGNDDAREAARKMRAKMQAMGGASEFNLG